MRLKIGASTMPAMPTAMKAVRQSIIEAITPPSTMPSALPIGTPNEYAPSARARWCGGKKSATSEYAGATPPASPTPTPSRARNSCQKFCARPQTAVIALHTTSAIVMIRVRLLRSANSAIGMPSSV